MSPVLITGGAGFVATNLADRLLMAGEHVRILDDLSRPGVEENLNWLTTRHSDLVQVELGDVRDQKALRRGLRGIDHVVHLAAQVAVTTSLRAPVPDAEVNLLGTLHLLEEARARPRPPTLLFTSTNKVYGALHDVVLDEDGRRHEPVEPTLRAHGVGEDRPLSFATPYGCSKGAADQYVLDWCHSFGVPTVVFRMSCIYGPHQHGTEDQGWVAHFLIRALEGEPVTVFGTGRQVRDILFVEDLVDAFALARAHARSLAGRAFNIGGGAENAVSLADVLALVERRTGSPIEVRHAPWRAGDQRWYVSDTRSFHSATGWSPRTRPPDGIAALHGWLVDARDPLRRAA